METKMSEQTKMEIDNLKEELSSIRCTLNEHSGSIYELQEATRRLEGGQERQAVAIKELSTNFGQVIGELGKLGAEYRRGKEETLNAIQLVSDHLFKLDAQGKEHKSVCEEKHKLVDHRLEKAEKSSIKALSEVADMSDQSKIYYIQNLQEQLEDYKKSEKEQKKDKKDSIKERNKIIVATITALFTGTGGALLIQWILEKF